MRTLKEVQDIVEHFGPGLVDAAIVYVAEAHASDQWALSDVSDVAGGAFDVAQHKSMEDRVAAARTLRGEGVGIRMRILVDLMDNNASETFAAVPERLVVLHEDRVAYFGGPGPFDYRPQEVKAWLWRTLG